MKRQKTVVAERIFRDGEAPICCGCDKPALALQIHCNCGCNGVWCQPCYLAHYLNDAIKITLQRFIDGDSDLEHQFAESLHQR